jgi:hypothetical protein
MWRTDYLVEGEMKEKNKSIFVRSTLGYHLMGSGLLVRLEKLIRSRYPRNDLGAFAISDDFEVTSILLSHVAHLLM